MSSPPNDSIGTNTHILAPGGTGGDDNCRPPGVRVPRERRIGPIQAEWIARIRPINWQLYCHLTFARPRAHSRDEDRPNSPLHRAVLRPVTRSRVDSAWDALIDRVARAAKVRHHQDRLLWFRVLEQHKLGELHIHALFASPLGALRLEPAAVLDRWVGPNPNVPRVGIAQVLRFDPTQALGAAIYVTKMADLDGDMMLSRALSWE